MAQKNRSKQLWLIPKRVNLHQTVCLIDGIIERNYDGSSWNSQKQDNLGVNLKRWGATKDGKNISQQAIRTLVASIPQYLGFIYINTDTSPNTICLTEAGKQLWQNHKDELVKVKNLTEGSSRLIKKSDIVLKQMLKLQITNPVIAKDCEGVLLFPFRFLLKLLRRLTYLDREEVAYFLFKACNESELDSICAEIQNFRVLDLEIRVKLIEEFKHTHIGNITLVKASSAGYFESLCLITGILEKVKVKTGNQSSVISALKIRKGVEAYVDELINHTYNAARVFDFRDNLELWIDYMGNPHRDLPPVSCEICNSYGEDLLIQIKKDGIFKDDDVLRNGEIMEYPMFLKEAYECELVSMNTGAVLGSISLVPDRDKQFFEIEGANCDPSLKEDSVEELGQEILEHCSCTGFPVKFLNTLNVLKKVTGVDKTMDKALRGAYLEFLFYRMLLKLKELNMVSGVTWNGRIGKYGLPVSAPGGVTGTPDIVFTIGDKHFVLELTTIKAKAMQFSAEGASVPDHMRLYKEECKAFVYGIFCAPLIHERNTASMKSILDSHGIPLNCVTDRELVEVFLCEDAEHLLNALTKPVIE